MKDVGRGLKNKKHGCEILILKSQRNDFYLLKKAIIIKTNNPLVPLNSVCKSIDKKKIFTLPYNTGGDFTDVTYENPRKKAWFRPNFCKKNLDSA